MLKRSFDEERLQLALRLRSEVDVAKADLSQRIRVRLPPFTLHLCISLSSSFSLIIVVRLQSTTPTNVRRPSSRGSARPASATPQDADMPATAAAAAAAATTAATTDVPHRILPPTPSRLELLSRPRVLHSADEAAATATAASRPLSRGRTSAVRSSAVMPGGAAATTMASVNAASAAGSTTPSAAGVRRATPTQRAVSPKPMRRPAFGSTASGRWPGTAAANHRQSTHRRRRHTGRQAVRHAADRCRSGGGCRARKEPQTGTAAADLCVMV